MTYPLQSEVSPTFRRFQGLVSCLFFSSKFTSSWGRKRNTPVNTQGTPDREPRHRHSQKLGENPATSWASMGHSDFARERSAFLLLAAPCSAMHTTRHTSLLHLTVHKTTKKDWE